MNPVKNDPVKTVAVVKDPERDDQFAAAYLKQGITHGITYQVKILTWVVWKLLRNSDASIRNWYLGTEVRNARGFHDLILKYDIDNMANGISDTASTRRVYRFVQIKHKLCLDNKAKITLGSLKSKQKKNQYSLIYLFKSYLNMLGNFEKIKMEQILDMTVFTNINIHSINFLVPVNEDPIFNFEGKGKRYRIDFGMVQQNPCVMERLRQVMPNDMIIYDFLRKLVFAVDQPSEFELEDRIVGEMAKVFSVPQIFYNDLYKSMIKWFLIYNVGTAPYLTEKQVLQYLFDAQNTFLRAKKSELYTKEMSALSEQLSEQLTEQLAQLHM
ncbi:uncharacterized protein LOC116850227 [Odontomachus brunneus]|uniref:uncharacterized protein LOC116850227 n=1 Tax=Odontomachus brunneus TaxID=486640 RepID=UPI0013F213AA|nr:uncharacterized protein LOC116850227 [Odontomachus brunneus]